MNSSDLKRLEPRLVTHTHTTPSNAVLVIRNVPAEVHLDRDGFETTAYTILVAEQLDDLISSAAATAMPDTVEILSFNDSPSLPDADYEIRFNGPDVSYSNATIQTWRLVFDKTYNAIKLALRGASGRYDGKLPNASFPRVAFLASGSITMGIRINDQRKLFPFDDPLPDGTDKALGLLIETSRWLDSEAEMPTELVGNDMALETILRAVEELSPATDSVAMVELRRTGEAGTANFSRQKRSIARSERIKVRIRSAEGARQLEFFGHVGRLDVNGVVRLKDVWGIPDHKKSYIDCAFEPDLLTTLLENFGRRVRVTAIQTPARGGWDTPEALDITRDTRETS